MSTQQHITMHLINLFPLINAFTNVEKEAQRYFKFMYGKEEGWTNEQISEYLSIMNPLLNAENMVLNLKEKIEGKKD